MTGYDHRPRKRFTWFLAQVGWYMLATVCGWTVLIITDRFIDVPGASGSGPDNASGSVWDTILGGVEAIPVLAIIFGIPTAIVLLVLAVAGRAKTGFHFRWRAIALIVPAGGLCFFIPSYPIWFAQTAIQFLFALLVQPPPKESRPTL